MTDLRTFLEQCEQNRISPQQIEAYLCIYRYDFRGFIDSLIRLSESSLLAFILLKNEIKMQSEPQLFAYVLQHIIEISTVPAYLYNEVIFICCYKMNDVPLFLIEKCERAADFVLISKLLALRCPSLKPLQTFLEAYLDRLFSEAPGQAVGVLVQLVDIGLYRRYFLQLMYLLQAPQVINVVVRAFAQIFSEFPCLAMQNSKLIVEIIVRALGAQELEDLGLLINAAFMMPSMLQIIEECSSAQQKQHIFETLLQKLRCVEQLGAIQNGPVLLLQGLQQLIRQSYFIYCNYIDYTQRLFEQEINNLLQGRQQTQTQIIGALFSGFSLEDEKYSSFAAQILTLLFQGLEIESGRFALHNINEGTVVALINVLITLARSHIFSLDMLVLVFYIAALAPNERLAVCVVNLLNTSIDYSREQCNERVYEAFRDLCAKQTQNLSNSPQFMNALSGLAQELLQIDRHAQMGQTIIDLIDFLLCRERIALALQGAVELQEAEMEAYTMGFELMEAAVFSGIPAMVAHAKQLISALYQPICTGLAGQQFDYLVLESVMRAMDSVSQVDTDFAPFFAQFEALLCHIAQQDSECSKYCYLMLGSYRCLMSQYNLQQMTQTALQALEQNIWSQCNVEIGYFLQKAVAPENQFNESILRTAVAIISDPYVRGELADQMVLAFVRLSAFTDVSSAYGTICTPFCEYVSETYEDREALYLDVFKMYDRWALWEVPQFRNAFQEACLALNRDFIENPELRRCFEMLYYVK